jgi:hypothetical protein
VSRFRNVARLRFAGAVILVSLLGSAVPASATAPSLVSGSVATTGQSGNHLYSATLTVDVAPQAISTSTVNFVVNCQATATPDASATSITECGEAPAASFPGDFAFTAAGFSTAVNTDVQLCVAGFATYVDTLLGDITVAGPRRCTTVTLTPLTSAKTLTLTAP